MTFNLSHSNENMKQCIRTITENQLKPAFGDLVEFLKLTNSQILENEDVVLLEKVSDMNAYINPKDKTGSECEQNHIHISDYVNNNNRGLVLLEIGLLFGKLLGERLKFLFPNYKFKIIISYDLKNESNLNDCVVRFHRVRKGEGWLVNDLEQYKDAAVGVMEV